MTNFDLETLLGAAGADRPFATKGAMGALLTRALPQEGQRIALASTCSS